jgi:hypothetical protein
LIDSIDELGWCTTFVDGLALTIAKLDDRELCSFQYGSVDVDHDRPLG